MAGLLHSIFASSPPFLLFTVIGLGYFLGHLRVFGFHLNVAAVLFVGIGFGIWDAKAFTPPESLYVLGLILFVYSIGLASGPSFFSLFRERGMAINLLAAISLGSGTLTAILLHKGLDVPKEILAGLFSGSLTNTPAMAAATEAVRERVELMNLPIEEAGRLTSLPTLGYSIAYPFGVLGVILAMHFVTRLLRVSIKDELEEYRREVGGKGLVVGEVRITNPLVAGKTLRDSKLGEITGAAFTRIKHGNTVALLTPETVLCEGDVMTFVGNAEAMDRVPILVGPRVNEGLSRPETLIEHRDLVMTNKALVGKPVEEINSDPSVGGIVSRVRRGYTNLPIDRHTTLEFGDRVRIVSYADTIDRVESRFGDPVRDLAETDFLSISLGIIVGMLVGMIPLPLPNGGTFSLGFAGGVLLSGLVLGRLGRTGPIIWTLPTDANLTIRQLGLHLFLAGIGIKAGGGFLAVFQGEGLRLFFCGAAITLVTSAVTLILGYKVFRIPMISLLGLTSGVHTQPACLAFAQDMTGSDVPVQAYSAVQPIAMILKIAIAQLIVGLL